jgi:deoxyribodipyrimidine photo-lyase
MSISKSNPKYENGLFIFTRDLRIQDNNGLNQALKLCKNVYTVFFFTPEQVSSSNSYKSSNAVRFMIESLSSLSENIKNKTKNGKLVILYNKPEKCLTSILNNKPDIDAVFINKDVTKYAKERFTNFQKICNKYEKDIYETEDYYLTEFNSIKNSSGGQYMKFTPFYNKILELMSKRRIQINNPYTPSNIKSKLKTLNVSTNSSTSKNANNINKMIITLQDAAQKFARNSVDDENINVFGGREEALDMLKTINKDVPQYEATRNNLNTNTTQLSAYIKFGNISIREVYYAFLNKLDKHSSTSLIRQLFWRDFYAQLMNADPTMLYKPMKRRYGAIKWSNSERNLEAWKQGKTGFPIVDAGMRQLLATGYMHNRTRLITSSFLAKTLFINWQEGEAHFARNLIDYDPASNNGNWQWTAGTGTDSQPYFRILNPFLQSKKYDADAEYIKRWIPELSSVSSNDIHKWDETSYKYPNIDYPSPIVDYASQKEKVLKAYSSI